MLKKMILFSLIMAFFYTTAAFGTGITFTFANGQITGTDPKYYEFDVMAAAGESGTRIGDSMAYINYNTAGFGSYVKTNGKITVTTGTLTAGLLYSLMVNDNAASRVAITAQYTKSNQPELANELPTTQTQWVHVKIEIAAPSQTTGMSFEQSLMSDNEYQSDNSTKYSPVTAIDTDDSSLPVELSSFTAVDTADGVELEWTTQTEVGNIGFYIYRSETREGEYVRVNKTIVKSAGNSAFPNTYSYIDDSVSPDVNTYFYYLEDVDIAGIKTKSQILEMTRRKVSKFTAEYQDNSVCLKWSVEPQISVHAWNIYRSTAENGARSFATGRSGSSYVKLDEPKIEFDDATHTYSYVESLSNKPNEYLYYYVEGMDSKGKPFIKSRTVKVEIIPDSFALFQNYPNPYNPETWIPYQLSADTTVTIKIYDVTGHVVRTLSLGEKRAGIYISRNRAGHWNGRNEAGERVSSGLYFYAIEAGNFKAIKRMLLVK